MEPTVKFGMNLQLWTGSVGEKHFKLFENIKKWGFDGVEIPVFVLEPRLIPKIRGCLNDLRLKLTTGTICLQENNPISTDPKIRGKAIDVLRKNIDDSIALRSEVLAGPFHSALGSFTGVPRTQQEWEWCIEYLKKGAQHAKQGGLKLSIEPLNRFECYFLNTMADSAELIKEVNDSSVGFLYDTFHANIEERDIRQSIVKNAAGINHVHISENDRGIPGTGHVRWDETLKALKEIKYSGWLTIESFGRALPELAAATKIWRELFESEESVAVEGLKFLKSKWSQ